MKYVMLQLPDGKKIPIIFPEFMVHSLVAKSMVHCLGMYHKIEGAKAVSAGSFRFTGLDHRPVACFGSSETMKLSADPQDAEVIVSYEYRHGL